MKIIAINGSPRKNWNTATLLNSALDGARLSGAETKMVHLYDLNFKGCMSCFACKQKNSKNFGKCTLNDDLKPILREIENADALIIGTPIYYGSTSGVMHMFLERLMFQYMQYTQPPISVFDGKINLGMVYTMNIAEDQYQTYPSKPQFERIEGVLKMLFGNLDVFRCYDTYQVNDYRNIDYTYLDPVKKKERRDKIFPIDCEKVKELGKKLVSN
jgi:multimeric flavodoxin WrbA